MKKTFTVIIITLIIGTVISLSSRHPTFADDGILAFEQGTKESFGDIQLVDLHGTWRQMGRQYGALMKKELDDIYAFVQLMMEVHEGNADKAESIAQRQANQTPYRLCEFFEGAAETSGYTTDQLQLINAVERIGGLPSCSVAMAWDSYTDGGQMVIGRNYDYSDIFSQLYEDVAVTIYHPSDGALATATIGYAGEIYAVNAINEKGIFLELNNGKPSADIKSPDERVTGTTELFNVMFEADELEDMERFFNTTNCSSSYIINVADSEKALSYEWCPVGVKHGEDALEEGLLVSTNYYLNPDWEFPVPSDEDCWEGITRRDNLISLCEADKGKIDENCMMNIIETPIEEGGAMNELTVYQLVVIPESFSVCIRVVDSPDPEWVKIDLGNILADK